MTPKGDSVLMFYEPHQTGKERKGAAISVTEVEQADVCEFVQECTSLP